MDLLAALRLLRRPLYVFLGLFDWVRFGLLNRLSCEGREHLKGLPNAGVLLVANHLTYYMDVLALHHALLGSRCSPLDGFRARFNVRFVVAFETLSERGILPRVFKYAGAVLIRRTWKHGDQDVQRSVDPGDLARIGEALRDGWLITFPQGTTTPGAPVRKGTAHIIRQHRPVVVPVVLEGIDKAFAKKGFRRIARGVDLRIRFGAPLAFAEHESVEVICERIAEAIGAPAPAAATA
jgi:1-acyl-sn-glycerol-3-phosphate acyltransferase